MVQPTPAAKESPRTWKRRVLESDVVIGLFNVRCAGGGSGVRPERTVTVLGWMSLCRVESWGVSAGIPGWERRKVVRCESSAGPGWSGFVSGLVRVWSDP